MPLPPYAKILISVNGGALQSGPVTVSNLDVIRLSGESQVGWQKALWEIFAYPPSYPTPAGWTLDDDHALLYSTAATPPAITLPATPLWGKWIARLRVNEASDTANDEIDQHPSFQGLRDESGGWEIISPSGLLRDTAVQEQAQFGGAKSYVADIQSNWRGLETAITGGDISGVASGDISGSYPGPLTVTKVNGATVPASGALTTGNVLQVSGSASLVYAPVNLAGGGNYVTGILPVANGGTGQSSFGAGVLHSNGTALTSSLIVNADITDATITLAKLNQSAATSGQVAAWNGSAWVPTTVTAGGTGAVPTSRTLTTTSPLTIDGGASADLSANRTIAIAAGTQYQVLAAVGAPGTPTWSTVHIDQAAALSGVGADGQIPYAASGHFAFEAELSYNTTTNVLTAAGGLSTPGPVTGAAALFSSLRVTGLVGPGNVVAAPDGTLSVGAGAGSVWGTLLVDTVIDLAAFSITGLPDRMPARVRAFPPGRGDEFFLVTSGLDGDGNALVVDAVNFLVVATAGAGAPKWVRA